MNSKKQPPGVFDPELVAAMGAVLDDLADHLMGGEDARRRLARFLLAAAERGERDPARLRLCALSTLRH